MGRGVSIGERVQETGERAGASLKNKEHTDKLNNLDLTKVGDGSLKEVPMKNTDPRKLEQTLGNGSLKDMPVKKGSIAEISNNTGDGALKDMPVKKGSIAEISNNAGKGT